MVGSSSAGVKVSVCMITYNHEPFIAQAIESVLMQRTDFLTELVIGEDCSTDATRSILRAYGERHQARIRLLLPAANLGMMPNFAATLQACRGKYIALLEGDDYWTAPDKLQKQANYLDSHADCASCFHPVRVLPDEGAGQPYVFYPSERRPRYSLDDLLESTQMQTGSVMFRRDGLPDLPDWFLTEPIGDWALAILNAQQGDAGFIDEVMGVYRQHAGGVWSSLSRAAQAQQRLDFYTRMAVRLGPAHESKIRSMEAICRYQLAVEHYLAGTQEAAAAYLEQVSAENPQLSPLWRELIQQILADVERRDGAGKAIDVIRWTAEAARGWPGGRAWQHALWRDWHVAGMWRAYGTGNPAAARRALARAVRADWRVLTERCILAAALRSSGGARLLPLPQHRASSGAPPVHPPPPSEAERGL